MEPRPDDKMPPNPILPIVRAVVSCALCDALPNTPYDEILRLAFAVADKLCETLPADGWDYSDRVRRASTKGTWGYDPIDETFP